MTDAPSVVRKGRVVGFFVGFIHDTEDEGDQPDELRKTGQAEITPRTPFARFVDGVTPKRTAVYEKLVCPIIGGYLWPPGTKAESIPTPLVLDADGYPVGSGVTMIASEQPGAEPDSVTYNVTFTIDGSPAGVIPKIEGLVVPVDGVVDLSDRIPLSTQPGTVIVYSSEDRIRAEKAADDAEVFRDQTEQQAVTGLSWSGAVNLAELADAPRMLHATLTGNVTVTLPTPPSERAFTVSAVLTQDATGGRTLTVTGARAAYGVKPALTAAAAAVDLVHFLWTGTGWVVLMGAPALAVPA